MDFQPGQYVFYRTWLYLNGNNRQVDMAARIVTLLPKKVRIQVLLPPKGYPRVYTPAVRPESLRPLNTPNRVALLAASSGDSLMWKRAPIDDAALAELIEAGYLVAGEPYPLITVHGAAALEWEARKK